MTNFPFILTVRLNKFENMALLKLAQAEGLPKSLVLRKTLHKSFREAMKAGIFTSQFLAEIEGQKQKEILSS